MNLLDKFQSVVFSLFYKNKKLLENKIIFLGQICDGTCTVWLCLFWFGFCFLSTQDIFILISGLLILLRWSLVKSVNSALSGASSFTFIYSSPWQTDGCVECLGPPAICKRLQSLQITQKAPELPAPEGGLSKVMTQESSPPRVLYKDTHEHMEIEGGLRQPESENWYFHAAMWLTHAVEATEHHPRLFPQVKELHSPPSDNIYL